MDRYIMGGKRLPDLRIPNVGLNAPEVGETQKRRLVVADGNIRTSQWFTSIKMPVVPDETNPRLFPPESSLTDR